MNDASLLAVPFAQTDRLRIVATFKGIFGKSSIIGGGSKISKIAAALGGT